MVRGKGSRLGGNEGCSGWKCSRDGGGRNRSSSRRRSYRSLGSRRNGSEAGVLSSNFVSIPLGSWVEWRRGRVLHGQLWVLRDLGADYAEDLVPLRVPTAITELIFECLCITPVHETSSSGRHVLGAVPGRLESKKTFTLQSWMHRDPGLVLRVGDSNAVEFNLAV